jgi:hypothetical protein
MSIPQIAKEIGIGNSTKSKIITELDGFNPIKAGIGIRVADACSPEDIVRIGERLEKGK